MNVEQRKLVIVTSLGKRYSGKVDLPNASFRTTDLLNSVNVFWKNPNEKCFDNAILMRDVKLFVDDAARRSLHALEDWAYSTRDGTLSSLPRLPRPEVWDYAQSDSHNCMGRKCPTYDKCFYQAARRRMENGDLLVCNHALFFSDLALRSQGVGFLPPHDHVILDEAHCAEEVAADHFGLSLAESRIGHLLRMLYDPRRPKKGEPPLVLDSAAGKASVHDYMRNETRFRMVEKIDAERFRRLSIDAQDATTRRVAIYDHMAKLTVPKGHEGGNGENA